jgi:hypothetical protein
VVSGPHDERVLVWSHAAAAGEESRNDGLNQEGWLGSGEMGGGGVGVSVKAVCF